MERAKFYTLPQKPIYIRSIKQSIFLTHFPAFVACAICGAMRFPIPQVGGTWKKAGFAKVHPHAQSDIFVTFRCDTFVRRSLHQCPPDRNACFRSDIFVTLLRHAGISAARLIETAISRIGGAWLLDITLYYPTRRLDGPRARQNGVTHIRNIGSSVPCAGRPRRMPDDRRPPGRSWVWFPVLGVSRRSRSAGQRPHAQAQDQAADRAWVPGGGRPGNLRAYHTIRCLQNFHFPNPFLV